MAKATGKTSQDAIAAVAKGEDDAIATKDKATKPKAPKREKKEVVLKPCGCGFDSPSGENDFDPCGKEVKGRFAQGHDARLKGRLLGVIYNPESSKADVAAARKRMEAEGWTKFIKEDKVEAEKEKAANRAKAEANKAKKAEKAAAKAAKETAEVDGDEDEDNAPTGAKSFE